MEPKFWDEKYAGENLLYGEEPNAYFRRCLSYLRPGRLLVAAAGEGRDAVYAATQRWEVTAIDFSKRAAEKIKKQAREKKLNIEVIHGDLSKLDLPEGHYNAVALTYAHFPPEIRSNIHEKLIRSLAPGGKMILEAFKRDQLRYNSGGPRDIELLYSPDILESDFKSLKGKNISTKKIKLDEGRGHKGKASVVRLFGTK